MTTTPKTPKTTPTEVVVIFTNHYPASRFSNWLQIPFKTLKAARKFLRSKGFSIKEATSKNLIGGSLQIILDAVYLTSAAEVTKTKTFNIAALIGIGYDTDGDIDEALRIAEDQAHSEGSVARFPPLDEVRKAFRSEFGTRK